MTAPSMVNGKFRRPIGMRDDVPAYDPRNDPNMGAVAFFEYREDAVAAAKEWVEPQGYLWRAQYMGRYDLWILAAKRKSWGYGQELLVEACRHPERVVVKHAHVPMRYAYDRIGAEA